MAKSSILGPDGRPIEIKTLTTEQATPTVTGVRQVATEAIASGLDPFRLATILKRAAEGEAGDFLTLAEEMEERDLHYAAVLGTRKRALTGIEPIIVAASDEPAHVAQADATRRLVEDPRFAAMLDDLLDGLGKGYAAVETLWERGDVWRPRDYIHRDPRFFRFDKTGRELRLKSDHEREGLPLAPYAFITHVPKLKSGLPIRGGLARLAAWAFVLKAFTLKDWAAFLEVFGMPLRVGKYGREAGPEEKRVLLRAVRDLGTDAAAIIPEGMSIEFIEAKGGQGNAVFGAMAEYLDAQVSKGVLGQTMTTDDGSSLAQAAIHENVRIDILRSDARQLAATINRDLIEPFVAFNFGPQADYPRFEIPVTEPEDIKTLSEVLDKLVPLGLEVQMSEVRDRLGFAEPDEGALLLGAKAPAPKDPPAPQGPKTPQDPNAPEAPAPDPEDPPATEKAAASPSVCSSCGGVHLGAAGEPGFETDRLVEDELGDWEQVMDPMLAPIRTALARAGSYDDFLAALDEVGADLDDGPLAERLAVLGMKARGLGDTGER